jgi:apolipoprotein N-acyltransferase
VKPEDKGPAWGRSLFPRLSPLASRLSPAVVAFLLGALTVAGFAPFGIYPLPVLTLALLAALWQRAASPRRAAAIGFAYGLGLFLAGVSWVYVSLHDFGAMPMPLAALTTLLFCAYLALFPAAAGWLAAAMPLPGCARLALWFPAVWTLLEWTRGWLFTGFPWLAFGYSQVPAGPLAGYAPLLGIYGVTLAAAATAGLLVILWSAATDGRRRVEGAQGSLPWFRFILHPSAFILAALWLGGWGLKQIAWTSPAGAPVSVSLLQGNVPQDLKWRPERVQPTLENYRRLALSATSRLIVLPETALPLFLDDVPAEYLAELAAHAQKLDGDILIGLPERVSRDEYYNSMLSFGASPPQRYRKSHLVPFGEFIPLRPLLGGIVSALAIPLQDFSRGAADQQPLEIAGQRVAVNICYEDAFGEEIIRQLPQATLLVNASNVAWFGRSIAPRQHLQISQARALETGRYMLRATNTGVTAVIDQRGRVVKSAPEFRRAIVSHDVPGFQGATPYVRWGNYAVLALCAVLLCAAWLAPRARPGR